MPETVLIVGGGHAGSQTAVSLRQSGFDGRVVIATDEALLPYQRPPLSKAFLSGSMDRKALLLRTQDFYRNQGIEVMTKARVERIDIEAKTVVLQKGEEMHWDQLVLATGSLPRRLAVPGAGLGNVFYLRTLGDSERIREAMANAEHLTIIGGGYIGLEVAASARKANKAVTVIEMEERILKRVTSAFMSNFYQKVHETHGVAIRTDTLVTALEGNGGRVGQVHTSDGQTLATDLVIAGIGILPATRLAEAAGIDCDNGILVDETCRTSVESIWAVGDCTNHPNAIFQRRMRVESVPNAMEQSRVVAANLTGQKKQHRTVPWFWSDQYHLKLQMAGFGTNADTEILRGSEEKEKFIRFYVQDGLIRGVDSVNCSGEFIICRKLIEQEKSIEPEQLADSRVSLKELLSN